MLSDEEIDAVLSNHGDNYVTIYRDLDFYYQLIAQAKEANALREQLATARSDALEEAGNLGDSITPVGQEFNDCFDRASFDSGVYQYQEAIRALKEKA